jgi:hypothetical protein
MPIRFFALLARMSAMAVRGHWRQQPPADFLEMLDRSEQVD